jgi:Fe-S-cluster containining protein
MTSWLHGSVTPTCRVHCRRAASTVLTSWVPLVLDATGGEGFPSSPLPRYTLPMPPAVTLRDALPALYRPWLGDFFDRPTLVETRATCSDCAMCDKSGSADPTLAVAFFRPEIKCCSYHPTLPNYLVGATLGDASPASENGRRRLRAKIAGRVGVTPHWLAAPRKYLVLLNAARDSSFGRSDALLCPYYERSDGTCSIWENRESVCATFFCKHVAGAAGWAFWAAMRRYLEHVERTLARHLAKVVDPETTEPDLPRNLLTREDLEDRPPSDDDYARWWRAWAGREEAFYLACAARARSLGRGEFERLVDDGPGAVLLSAVRDRYDAVTAPKLATRLVKNPEMRALPGEGGVAVTTYSRYDSLLLSKDLFDAVSLFAGDPVDTVLERLKKEHDVDFPRDLLLTLQLQGVLTEPV